MANSKQIVYLSQAQYAELIANGSITVDGVTVTYDQNDIYVTPQAEPVTDVRVAGTSVTANGVANVPLVTAYEQPGAFMTNYDSGSPFRVSSNGVVDIKNPTAVEMKAGSSPTRIARVNNQHLATFYGLAKAAGHDEKDSTEPLGTYTPEAKGAIQKMLGVSDLIATEENNLIASKAYTVGDVFTANGKLYKATAAIAVDAAIITDGANANCEEVTVADGFVKKTDIATNNDLGIVRGRSERGVTVVNGWMQIVPASAEEMKTGQGGYRPLTGDRQHIATFYGLATAAGDTTQSQSDNAVGTYTDNAKAAIRTMLGATSSNVIAVQDTQPTDSDTKIWLPETAETPVEVPTMEDMNTALAGKVGDVQVNGTSIVSNGVANVPFGTGNAPGVVLVGNGFSKTVSTGRFDIQKATSENIKKATANYTPIVPSNQHESTFYGLAAAAGDTTQSASDNAVGTYTDNAKASIKAMLGIQDGSTGTVDVSGTTPTIAAVENTRYICGEVTSLSFTPPASGIAIVRFTSGTSVTVLTIPSTVKFPEWFDPTSLETNTIYEICVTDGVYGAVMSWAL